MFKNGVILVFRGVWWTTGVAAAEMQGDVMCLYVLKECRRKKKERRRKRKIVNKKSTREEVFGSSGGPLETGPAYAGRYIMECQCVS